MRQVDCEAPANCQVPNTAEILTVEEAAEYVRLKKNTLDIYRTKGNGPPFIRISAGAVRYRRSDLKKWLESRIVTSTSQAA